VGRGDLQLLTSRQQGVSGAMKNVATCEGLYE
jgi:hypothetical protein